MDSKLILFSCAFKEHVDKSTSKKQICRNRAYKHYIKLFHKQKEKSKSC